MAHSGRRVSSSPSIAVTWARDANLPIDLAAEGTEYPAGWIRDKNLSGKSSFEFARRLGKPARAARKLSPFKVDESQRAEINTHCPSEQLEK
jgi:hypothetical protein